MPEPKINSDDYYQVLGLEKGATDAQIKKAFRRLAMKYHPDKAKGDKAKAEANFKKISEAYEVLSDKEKRQKYDQFGKGGFQGMDFNFTDPNDLFSKVFGGNGGDAFANMFSQGFGGQSGGMSFQFGGSPGMQSPFGAQMGGFPGQMGGFSSQMGGGFPMDDIFSQFMGGSMGGGFPHGKRKQRSKVEYDCLKKGTVVSVQNLQNHAYLNDYQGVIKSYDRQRDRYVVDIDDFGEKSLKRTNFVQLIGNVKVIDLKSMPELNLAHGFVYDCDRIKKRGFIRVKNKTLSLAMDNLMFPKGTVLEISGLQKMPRYNGRCGTVMDIDVTKRRYTIQLSETEKLSIRFANVLP